MNQRQQPASDVPGASAKLPRLRAYDLQINTEAALPYNQHSLSTNELILDALAFYRNKLIEDLEETVTEITHNPHEFQRWGQYFSEGEFRADLNHIRQLSTEIDVMAGQAAATLREVYRANPQHAK